MTCSGSRGASSRSSHSSSWPRSFARLTVGPVDSIKPACASCSRTTTESRPTGLQALRQRPAGRPGIELAVIAPDGNRSAMARSITTRRPLWVQEVDFGDGTVGYATDGTPVDCVRLAEPRAGRGLRGRARRVRHQPRLEPRRRHHLLGHGGGCARGDRARAARDRGLAAVECARARLQGREGFDFTVAATFTARLVAELETAPLPTGTLLNINVPGAAPAGVEVARLGKRVYRDELSLVEEDRTHTRDRGGCTASTATRASSATRRHRSGRGGAGQDRGHAGALRPHRPRRHVGARALRPRAAGRAGGERGPERG